MPPDWDFNGDEAKRRAFVEWVGAELDRWATLTAARLIPQGESAVDWAEVLRGSRLARPVGHPADPTAGMNELVWEYGLLRYMFERYWPSRRRRVNDPASAASIAVARCRAALPRKQRIGDRIKAYEDHGSDLRRRLLKEWDCGIQSPGRQQAAADVAYLASLPANLFARIILPGGP